MLQVLNRLNKRRRGQKWILYLISKTSDSSLEEFVRFIDDQMFNRLQVYLRRVLLKHVDNSAEKERKLVGFGFVGDSH